ncbi:hypothetical protein AZE42_07197, partial [Rhizopogon vesiculosus]
DGKVVETALDHVNPQRDRPIYLRFDVDALGPSVPPGTGTPTLRTKVTRALTKIPQVRGGLIFREGHYVCEAVHETGLFVVLDLMVCLTLPPCNFECRTFTRICVVHFDLSSECSNVISPRCAAYRKSIPRPRMPRLFGRLLQWHFHWYALLCVSHPHLALARAFGHCSRMGIPRDPFVSYTQWRRGPRVNSWWRDYRCLMRCVGLELPGSRR